MVGKGAARGKPHCRSGRKSDQRDQRQRQILQRCQRIIDRAQPFRLRVNRALPPSIWPSASSSALCNWPISCGRRAASQVRHRSEPGSAHPRTRCCAQPRLEQFGQLCLRHHAHRCDQARIAKRIWPRAGSAPRASGSASIICTSQRIRQDPHAHFRRDCAATDPPAAAITTSAIRIAITQGIGPPKRVLRQAALAVARTLHRAIACIIALFGQREGRSCGAPIFGLQRGAGDSAMRACRVRQGAPCAAA